MVVMTMTATVVVVVAAVVLLAQGHRGSVCGTLSF
jgi:hypothetical protein